MEIWALFVVSTCDSCMIPLYSFAKKQEVVCVHVLLVRQHLPYGDP